MDAELIALLIKERIKLREVYTEIKSFFMRIFSPGENDYIEIKDIILPTDVIAVNTETLMIYLSEKGRRYYFNATHITKVVFWTEVEKDEQV